MIAGRSAQAPAAEDPAAIRWAWALLALAVLAHVWGLGGQYIPRNGDEMVYAHIARATALSGHWLPLVSELGEMRNTKPPLLFWQAMLATDGATSWSLLRLRLPSALYTALVAAACLLLTWRARRSWSLALISAAVFLAFLSTFRYGRPYLTSAPESLWLNVPMFWLCWQIGRGRQPLPSWFTVVALGMAVGVGSLYKSFAMVVPSVAAFWAALLVLQWQLGTGRAVVVAVTARATAMAICAISVFALWFAFDPDPASVWREFVMAENAGKLGSEGGYLRRALLGRDSVWIQALAYLQNAGAVAPLVPALLGVAWRSWRAPVDFDRQPTWLARAARWDPLQVVLAVWLLTWLLVFCLPSARSARYVIPAMPALAVLIALHWRSARVGWFLGCAGIAAMLLLGLARLAWVAADLGIATRLQALIAALVVGAGLGCALWAAASARHARAASLASCLLVYLAFAAVTAPLDGPRGRFEAAAGTGLERVAVPSNFRASWEQYRFLFPRAELAHYEPPQRQSAPAVLQRLLGDLRAQDALVWMGPEGAAQPSCSPTDCRVLAVRWSVRTRHEKGEVSAANVWYPQDWLFRREWLLGKPLGTRP